jgi:hypothetical protein
MVTGAFPKERKVVERERMGNAYHISAYFLAKVATAFHKGLLHCIAATRPCQCRGA